MNTLSERLQYCRVCKNKMFDSSTGINCGLTQSKPEFKDKCEKFIIDEGEAQKLLMRKKMEAEGNEINDTGFFGAEKRGMKKGVVGGIIMIAIALIWFFGGLAAGIIFYYPPILLIIGIIALVKGLAEKNFSGEKYKKIAQE